MRIHTMLRPAEELLCAGGIENEGEALVWAMALAITAPEESGGHPIAAGLEDTVNRYAEAFSEDDQEFAKSAALVLVSAMGGVQ